MNKTNIEMTALEANAWAINSEPRLPINRTS